MHPNFGLLITRIVEDKQLQEELCKCESYTELRDKIKIMGYCFPEEELREFIDRTCWYAPQWQ